MQSGTVKWFDARKGFGFITPADGSEDVFVHYSAIDGRGYRMLEDGQKVQYVATRTAKGLQASTVVPV